MKEKKVYGRFLEEVHMIKIHFKYVTFPKNTLKIIKINKKIKSIKYLWG